MKKSAWGMLPLLLLATTSWAQISNYEPAQESCAQGSLYAFRKFNLEGRQKYVVVDTKTFETKVMDSSLLRDCTSQPIVSGMNDNPYFQAVNDYNSNAEDVGACQGFKQFPKSCGAAAPMVMTSDLCPSARTFEQWSAQVKPFLQKMAALGTKERSTPIVLAVTSKWIQNHPDELKLIKSMGLKITWANHSTDHGLIPGPLVPVERAFLVAKTGAAFVEEVLGTERTLLKNGIVPTPFFRFPGLFSTSNQIDQLRALGMIPLNATAWLALDGGPPKFYKRCGMINDQKASGGRVILTHANGNEPLGIVKALQLLETQKDNSNFISVEQAVRCDVASRKPLTSQPLR